MSYEDHEVWITDDKAQFILTLGHRGFGKSVVNEYIAEGLYNRGWTILDLWAADNLENLFWCVNLNHKKQNEIEKLRNPDKPRLNECQCSKRYPITVFCSEYVQWDEKGLDWFNEIYYTKDEWVLKMRKKGEAIVCYERQNPPKKPKSEMPKTPWIRIKPLLSPTRKNGTEANHKLIQTVTNAILEARKERRIVCFNPKLFPVEWEAFKTLELILRELSNITYKYFNKLDEKTVGKPESQWSWAQKNWHRMAVVMREFGEITPSGTKGDQSGDSTLVKKSLISFVKKSRHYGITLAGDAQRESDIIAGVKVQTDVVILKKSSKKLLGESLEYLSDIVEKKREEILNKFGYNATGFKKANTKWPRVASLQKNQMYIVWDDDFMKLHELDMPINFHHKKPDDHWSSITQVYCNIPDTITISSKSGRVGTESSQTDEKLLYSLIYEKKHPKTGKPPRWDETLAYLADLQEKGKVSWSSSFKDMKPDTLATWFRRKSKTYSVTN